jgi:hypothetical protein
VPDVWRIERATVEPDIHEDRIPNLWGRLPVASHGAM